MGHAVVGIKAVDPDEELDGVVSYHLLSQSPNDGTFTLDSQSGLLTVSDDRNLDFETTSQYNLTIEAKDGGESPGGSVHFLPSRKLGSSGYDFGLLLLNRFQYFRLVHLIALLVLECRQ